jgi:hypothetical protein
MQKTLKKLNKLRVSGKEKLNASFSRFELDRILNDIKRNWVEMKSNAKFTDLVRNQRQSF